MTSVEHDFRKVSFRSPEVVDKPWFEWFCDEFSRRSFRMDFQPNPDVPLRFEVTSRQIPNLRMHLGAWSSMRTVATPEAMSDGTFGLSVALKGDLMFGPRDDKLKAAPGAGVFGRPSVLDMQSGATFFYVQLSSSILAPLVPNLADISLISLPANAQPMRLLSSYLRILDAEDRIETSEAQHLAAQHVHDLVALALGTTRDATVLALGRGASVARLAAVKQDILAHLADPGLSVAEVANRQGLTPRYVHKLWETEGMTFSEFVVGQRLGRTWQMLTDPRFAGHSIGAIALMVGFGDLSYFNRTFRRRFGATPTEVRSMAWEP